MFVFDTLTFFDCLSRNNIYCETIIAPQLGHRAPATLNCVVYPLLQFHYVSFLVFLNSTATFRTTWFIVFVRHVFLVFLRYMEYATYFEIASNIRCLRVCISMANKCDVYVPYPSTHYCLLIHHSCPSLSSCIFVVSWWLIEVLSSCEP